MNQSRLEWKVGLFVLICLGVLAALLLNFSKGVSFFKPTYEVQLRTTSVGGIKPKAFVLMAGVPVGSVQTIVLDDDGRTVMLHLRIERRYKIHADAKFNIESAGFLGDQYVAIEPTKNALPPLLDGAVVTCREPFNIQEAARSAVGLMERVDRTVEDIHETVRRVSRTVLGDQTLTNLTATIENFRSASDQAKTVMGRAGEFSDKAIGAVERLDLLIVKNTPVVNETMTNLSGFSGRLNTVADELRDVIASSRGEISTAVKNLEHSTAILTNLLGDLQAGKGLAGGLLKDEKMKTDVLHLVGNYTTLASNLSQLSSNLNLSADRLNTNGLWRFLWKPKPPAPAQAGRNPGQ
ncbi:MAG: MCE family protein [Verrucomicrobia bacterium]|nr:MCE family protein [Verrucomicrobiota bacterium]